MTTTRTQARAEIVAALIAVHLFADVSDGLKKKFEVSPVAVVRSQSYDFAWNARKNRTFFYGLAVTIYVWEEDGTGIEVETKLDVLVAATVDAILALEGGDDTTITTGPSVPPDGEVLQRTIDGKVYRAERIPVIWQSEG